MMWTLNFISEEDFTNHVKATIGKYGEKLESFDLKRFNKNIIDPIKLIFDKTVYHSTWDEIVSNEIFRQRDKSNNNDPTTTILDTSIRESFSILPIAMFRLMVKKVDGM